MSKLPIHKLPGASALTGIVLANGSSAATALKINRAAITNPGVGNDSSQGYAALSMWLNTLTNHWFIASSVGVGAAVWTDITSAGANGISRETITVANAFAAGNVIRRTAGGYTKAQADSASDANALGIVETASGTDFTIVYSGKITLTAHGFTVGAVLYLDPTTAGLLTVTEPVTIGQVDRQMGIVLDANTILVMSCRGIVVPAVSGTVTSVDATAGLEVAAGAPITSSGTLRGSHVVNAQTGVSYAVLTGDRGKVITHTNAAAIAYTIAQAGSVGFESGWFVDIQNRGLGTLALTPATSTIDGAATLVLGYQEGVRIFSDGSNYFTLRGGAAQIPAFSRAAVFGVGAGQTWTNNYGVTKIIMELWAGGGSGGSSVNGVNGGAGAGGGGGAYIKTIQTVTPGQVLTFKVGGSDDETNFGTIHAYPGGVGATAQSSGFQVPVLGGAGGLTAGTGANDEVVNGAYGGGGPCPGSNTSNGYGGAGGKGGGGANNAGGTGTTPGGGGGGGNQAGGGGGGGNGRLIIWY